MCHLHRRVRVRDKQLPRKMVINLFNLNYANPDRLYSYANYGGVPVKAEYNHEAVSACTGTHMRLLIMLLGSPTHLAFALCHRGAVWTVH